MKFILTDQGKINESESVSDSFIADFQVYEVFRIIDGIPLFLEDHFERLLNSLLILGLECPLPFPEFLQRAFDLISLNQQRQGNVRFVLVFTQHKPSWYFSFVPYVYPKPEDFRNGINTSLLEAERENPNAKVMHKNIRDKANSLIAEQNLYEVLLTGQDGFITEGSRSNVFFIKGNVFYTAPESRILVGITRQKVIACLHELGFRLVEEAVRKTSLETFESVFLTGTSPKVLPVRTIDGLFFNPQHEILRMVMRKYDEMIISYIEDRKKVWGNKIRSF